MSTHPFQQDSTERGADGSLTRADFSTFWPVPTRWADNDQYGHVNNAVYYQYFDTAVNGWLSRALGRPVDELPALGVVAETGCRYLRQASFPDLLEIGIAVTRLGRSSISYELGVFSAGDAPHAVGRFVHVYVDRETRRPVPIPPEVAAAAALLTR